MLRLIKLAKLPLPLCQYPVKEGGRTVAVLDFAYPELRLAIETDGYRYHSSPSDLERDVSRANAINRLGWRLLRFTRNQVVECPEEVVAAIRQAVAAGRLAERGKRLPA